MDLGKIKTEGWEIGQIWIEMPLAFQRKLQDKSLVKTLFGWFRKKRKSKIWRRRRRISQKNLKEGGGGGGI